MSGIEGICNYHSKKVLNADGISVAGKRSFLGRSVTSAQANCSSSRRVT